MTTSIPLFLSSNRVSSSTSEAAFTQQLKPPIAVPSDAKAVRCYVDSATIPFSFPNLDETTAKVVVRIPLRNPTNASLDSGEQTLTLPTGVFDLSEVAEQINLAANKWLHDNGYPVLVGTWQYYDFRADQVASKSGVANFCSLMPNFHKNRVECTLNYDNSEIDFADTDTSLDDLLGLTEKIRRTTAAQVSIPVGGYQLPAAFCTIPYGGGGNEWQNVTLKIPAGTYTQTTLCTAINSAYVTAVNARSLSQYDSPKVAAATATGPLLSAISLEPAYEAPGEYRCDADLVSTTENFASFPSGDSTLGNFDSNGALVITQEQSDAVQNLLGTIVYTQLSGTDAHTRASMWTGAQSTPFTGSKAATIDKVTEIGVACPGLTHGSYGSGGSSAGSTLARFQVSGSPGSNMVYRPSTPLKVDASHLIGARLQDINVSLVDQHGVALNSLQGEKYSVVLVIEYDM